MWCEPSYSISAPWMLSPIHMSYLPASWLVIAQCLFCTLEQCSDITCQIVFFCTLFEWGHVMCYYAIPSPLFWVIWVKYTEITEVNLSAFVYRLFHEHFSSVDRTWWNTYYQRHMKTSVFRILLYMDLMWSSFLLSKHSVASTQAILPPMSSIFWTSDHSLTSVLASVHSISWRSLSLLEGGGVCIHSAAGSPPLPGNIAPGLAKQTTRNPSFITSITPLV